MIHSTIHLEEINTTTARLASTSTLAVSPRVARSLSLSLSPPPVYIFDYCSTTLLSTIHRPLQRSQSMFLSEEPPLLLATITFLTQSMRSGARTHARRKLPYLGRIRLVRRVGYTNCFQPRRSLVLRVPKFRVTLSLNSFSLARPVSPTCLDRRSPPMYPGANTQ